MRSLGVVARTALIIDDEPRIRGVVRNALAADFTAVVEASTAADAFRLVHERRPGFIVLDLGLPDMSGVTVCERIRQTSDALILVLSARNADREKALLLDAGADDYMTKPFSTIELTARVRALQRRTASSRVTEAGTIGHGALVMDVEKRSVVSDGQQVHLTPLEWDLLKVLMTNAGKTLTHRQLFDAVWTGRQFGDAQQYLRVHIANLRRKVEANPLDPRFILTEPGVGYRFVAPPADRTEQ
jgi:two-component system, OmpR family, KDP operon response regulator KdpE